jgi:hypothetical protein
MDPGAGSQMLVYLEKEKRMELAMLALESEAIAGRI